MDDDLSIKVTTAQKPDPNMPVDLTSGDPKYENLTQEEWDMLERISKKRAEKRNASAKETEIMSNSLELLKEMNKVSGNFKGKVMRKDGKYYIQLGKENVPAEIPTEIISMIVNEIAMAAGGTTYYKNFEVQW
jgi:uncharacterized alpha-E superfamily protein